MISCDLKIIQYKLKIVFIYRPYKQGANSIENVFEPIVANLSSYNLNIVVFKLRSLKYLFFDILKLRKLRADIFHITGDVNYISIFLPSKKIVLTVHDLGHLMHSLKSWKKVIYGIFWFRLPIWKCRMITTVSQKTKQDLIDYLKVKNSKISVIENCFNSKITPSYKNFNSNCPLILQVGTREYKNVKRLILSLKDIKCKLYLVGELDVDIVNSLESNKISYENQFNLSNKQIYNLYEKSDIVSFVSIGEGFGMPILEAQASARALITSDLSPMSIIAGHGACLANPFDVESIKTAFIRIISNENYRNKVIENGLLNIKNYTPEVITKKYLQLYISLLDDD